MGHNQREEVGLVWGDERSEVFALKSQNLAQTY